MNQLPLFPHIPVTKKDTPEQELADVVDKICRPLSASGGSGDRALVPFAAELNRDIRRVVAQAVRATYLLTLQGKDRAITAAIDRLEA